MYPEPKLVALRLAVMFKRSNKTRARVSDKTLRLLSRRKTLRESFLSELRVQLEDLDILTVRLERGGYAIVAAHALEGAPTITAKQLLPEWKKLNEEDLWNELSLETDDTEE